ncbi:MAG TPA: sigma-70 family RNA polymerase sigma factor [Candidatus Limnocylindria bacterium]|jgi:RNA polymerase sigma factor (sigma-70 family)|nr:sigma-70 family RNA polymerase sigma factor [Candidatus Limnocylindria bacterium]
MDDHELLRLYVEAASEDAFRQLVERHGGLVYGVALRQLRRPHDAEEVAHAVFMALAKKAGALQAGTVLAGWLFRATRFAAAKLQRDEERRQRRERETAAMMDAVSTADSDKYWEQIVPVLDDELAALGEKDRTAILLRFFQDRSFREVGQTLGTSEDAAKMRVSRALENLRQRFKKRGVVLPAIALAAAFGGKASAATLTMPSALALSVTKSALTKQGAVPLVQAIAQRMAWWKWKRAALVTSLVLILVLAGAMVFRQLNAPKRPIPVAPAWPPRR